MSDNWWSNEQRFDPGIYQQVAAEYYVEIRELSRISKLPSFDSILASFTENPDLAQGQPYPEQQYIPEVPGELLSGGFVNATGGILPVFLRDALDTAHIAACCHLLHGSRVSRQQLTSKALEEMAGEFTASLQSRPGDYLKRIVRKYHTMDAMRTMQLLRRLRLVNRACVDIHLLAIGAGDGTRDVLSLHMMPRIDTSIGSQGTEYYLHADKQLIADAVIIDLAPIYEEHYAALNKDPLNRISAFNMDTIEALKALPDTLVNMRNMVTALRIDHRMIDDVPKFLSQLSACIDGDCDFILSIGAGDTLEEFEGRISKVQEIFSALRAAGLVPVVFKFHADGGLEQQWSSLRYGNPRASSYQLLYCRIDSGKLRNRYC